MTVCKESRIVTRLTGSGETAAEHAQTSLVSTPTNHEWGL